MKTLKVTDNQIFSKLKSINTQNQVRKLFIDPFS